MQSISKDVNAMTADELDQWLDEMSAQVHEDIQPLSVGGRVKRFCEAFSLGEPAVNGGGSWLHASGAERDLDPMGVLNFPPKDRNERWKRINRYWELRLKKATREFKEQKSQLVAYANAATNVRPPHCSFAGSDSSLSELKRLAGIVRRIQAKLEEVKVRIDATRPIHEVQREQSDAEARTRATQFLADVAAIQI